jgi:SAM-dependent methyltransferase
MPRPIADAPGFDFVWERGYFRDITTGDRRGTSDWDGKLRKNIDFLRLKDKAIHLVDPRPGRTVLELGCGAGAQLVYCGLLGAEVHGVDVNPDAITIANAKIAHLEIAGEARLGDVQQLDYGDDIFDVVLSSDCHEHLPKYVQLGSLCEALRVLKPGGYLILKSPNLAYLHTSLTFKRVRAMLRGADPRGFVIPWTSSEGPDAHVGLTTRGRLGRQLAEAGFLNWQFSYAPLRRFGQRFVVDVLSTEIPLLRDLISEDLFVKAYKPVALSYFPD